MKRVLAVLVASLLAVVASGATVVLKGGKTLDGVTYEAKGGYVVVWHPNGKVESYPLGAVDVAATRSANQEPEQAVPTAHAAGPHSPFLSAVAAGGDSAARVTDADVAHMPTPEEAESGEESQAGEGTKPAAGAEGARVVLVNQERRPLEEEGMWEVVATLANQGTVAATGVNVKLTLLDVEGNAVGSGSGSLAGALEPGQQGSVTMRIQATGEPVRSSADVQWQVIQQAPAPAPQAAAARPQAVPQATPEPDNTGLVVPEGASPNAVPSNPMNLTAPPQVAPRQPPA